MLRYLVPRTEGGGGKKKRAEKVGPGRGLRGARRAATQRTPRAHESASVWVESFWYCYFCSARLECTMRCEGRCLCLSAPTRIWISELLLASLGMLSPQLCFARSITKSLKAGAANKLVLGPKHAKACGRILISRFLWCGIRFCASWQALLHCSSPQMLRPPASRFHTNIS